MYEKIAGNREYKDNVFRLLFGNEIKSAELYNAIKGTNYAPSELKMNTIQNPFFFGILRNDVSFTAEDRLIVLFEHNSSVNPNIGLRFLLYISQLYDFSIDRRAMYKSKRMTIPKPEFYMLYNGKEDYPEKSTVKLSDLFELQDDEEINLELTVTVINVNKGYNKPIMERSRTLDEYAELVARVRNYVNNGGLELTEALKKAIEDCAREGILQEFLERYGGEIVSLLSREWNLDEFLEVRKEEAKEEIAEEMIKRQIPLAFILEVTKLPKETVEKIAKKYNERE